MAEDDALPDLSLKKKKKKKKPFEFDIDAAQSGVDGDAAESSYAQRNDEPNLGNDPPEEEPQEKAIEDFSLDFGGMKKKKKKKKAFDLEDLTDALPQEKPEAVSVVPESVEADDQLADAGDEDLNLSLPAKKKKKKKKVDIENLVAEDEENQDPDMDGIDGMTPQMMGMEGKAWLSSDRDYTYDELLTQVFDIMREKNPDMVAGEKKKFVMRPPQVLKVGTRKTSFANFSEICRLLHRQPKHVLAFLLAELGTSGSVDGHNQLIIRGKYNQKQIENVLRRYIKEYVTCHTCRSPDTLLQKDTRLFFLQCETCGSRCSVVSIKSGFQAVTGKRAAIRAKTA